MTSIEKISDALARPWPRWWRISFILSANLLALSYLILQGLGHGQDINWDLLNYHYYLVYSLFHDRMLFDIAPAKIQNFFNPLLNIPSYLFITRLPPNLVRSALCCLDGLAFGSVFWLTLTTVRNRLSDSSRYLLAASAGAVAISAPTFLAIAGTSFVDDLCVFPILGALTVLLAYWRGDPVADWRAFAGSAFLLGVAAGLKPTNMVYVIGYGVAVVATLPFSRLRVASARLALCAIGGAIGILVSGGWWGWRLYRAFGNPLFPFYNDIFRSLYFPEIRLLDPSALPKSFAEGLFRPFHWLVGGGALDPMNSVRDLRFAAALFLILVFVLAAVRRLFSAASAGKDPRRISEQTAPGRILWFLILFFVVSFYVCLAQFGHRRYLVPLEALSPVLLLLLIAALVPGRWLWPVWIVAAVAAIGYGQPLFPREAASGKTYFQADELAAPYADTKTTFLMISGWEPISYLVPSFTRDNRFIHLGGDFPVVPGTAYGDVAQAAIDHAPGPLKVISNTPIIDRVTLARFGLTLTGHCTAGRTIADVIHICDLSRAPPSDAPAAAPLPLGKTIEFRAGGRGWVYETDPACWGWSEDWGTWATSGQSWCSELVFRLDRAPEGDLRLDALAHVFMPPGTTATRDVAVALNGHPIGVWNFAGARATTRSVIVPKALLTDGTNHLAFTTENAVSLHDVGVDPTDNRKLAMALHSLRLTEASAK